jgi:diadenosine tetraphosphate (Ap4A) HIT family hydrolase
MPKGGSKHVNLKHARFDDQREVMERIEKDGHCPFCEENLRLYHKQPILRESGFWILTTNQWPKKHTRVHLLLIYKKHAVKLEEIEPQAAIELFELVAWAEKEFKVDGGILFMRFGDTTLSGASVYHLHVQFVVPDIDDPTYESVGFKTG